MKRRTAIKIVALSAVSSNLDTLTYGLCHSDAGTAWSAANYHLRFFTPEENQLLDQLMEMVIPADGHSPGAHAAQVSLFADLMVSTSSAAVQKQWREGLKLIQEESTKSSLAEALAKSAANEGHPTTDLERFFRLQAKPVDLLCHFLGHEEHPVVNRREHVLGIAELRIAELALGELEGGLYGDVGLKLDLLEGHCISPWRFRASRLSYETDYA